MLLRQTREDGHTCLTLFRQQFSIRDKLVLKTQELHNSLNVCDDLFRMRILIISRCCRGVNSVEVDGHVGFGLGGRRERNYPQQVCKYKSVKIKELCYSCVL